MIKAISRSSLVAILVAQLACLDQPVQKAAKNENEGAVATHKDALVVNPTFQLLQPRADDVVPALRYQSGVSPEGAATLLVSIWTPPGRNGVEPSISLSYSSRGGVGLLGLGFGLSGLSTIERCWKSPAVDGHYSTAATEDEFCLDGVRLIRVPNTDQFFPEGTPGTRLSLVGPASDPSGFAMQTSDGLIRSFGTGDNLVDRAGSRAQVRVPILSAPAHSDLAVASRGALRTAAWYLDNVRDRWGNYMQVDYDRLVGTEPLQSIEVRPHRIRYTGNVGLAPSREVTFEYQPNARPRLRRVAQVPIRYASRLSRIKVKAQDRTTADPASSSLRQFREYVVTYLPPDDRRLDRVRTISECYALPGAQAPSVQSACSEPLTLSWSGTTTPRIPTFTTTNLGPVEVQNPTNWGFAFMDVLDAAVGDFDGDGFDDYLVRTLAVGGTQTPLTGSGPAMANARWLLSRGSPGGLGAPVEVILPASSGSFSFLSARAVDFDGDGDAEVLLVINRPPTLVPIPAPPTNDVALTYNQAQVYDVFDFAGSDFLPLSIGEEINTAQITDRPMRRASLTTGDIDGDGLVDILTDDKPATITTPGLWLRRGLARAPLSIGAGSVLALPAPAGGVARLTNASEKHLVDIDGNGVPELLGRFPGSGVGDPATAGDDESASLFAISVPAQQATNTRIHASDILNSETAEFGLGIGCSPGNFHSFFGRVFADVDGDGLRDSIAYPLIDRDACAAPPRDWRGAVFTSVNLGGIFAPATIQFVPARVSPTSPEPAELVGRIGPSMIEETNSSVVLTDNNRVARPLFDRTSHFRTIDNGLRIVDFDGDGLEDLLTVGELIRAIGDAPNSRKMHVALSNGAAFDPPIELPMDGAPGLAPDGSGTYVRGNGPRAVRIGDFNGDGLFDIAVVGSGHAYPDIKNLIVHLQDARPVDAIVSVSGGPQTALVEFQFAYWGPTLATRLPQQRCGVGQTCPRRFGWVVAKLRREANAFDEASRDFLETQFRYGTPTRDIRGRGFLGFSRWTSETEGLTESHSVDFSPLLILPNGGFTYLRPTTTTTTTTTPSGQYAATIVNANQLVAGRSNYRIELSTSESTVVENGSQTRHTKTTIVRDTYGTPTRSETRWLNAIGKEFSAMVDESTGANAPDESAWLVNRYPRVVSTSREVVGGIPTSDSRTSAITYEPASTEILTAVSEPDSPVETLGTNGLRLTTTSARDAVGNTRTLTVSNGLQQRVTTYSFDPIDRIFPVTVTNPETHVQSLYWHAGLSIPFAKDDANEIRGLTSFDAFSRPRLTQSGLLADGSGRQGGATSEFTYTRVRASPTVLKRTFWQCEMSNANGETCSLVDPAGRVIEQAWNHYDGVTSTKLTYDRLGRLRTQSLPRNSEREAIALATSDFDRLGRIVAKTRPGESRGSASVTQTWSYPPLEVVHMDERQVRSVLAVDPKGRKIRLSTFEPMTQREVRVAYEYTTFDQLERTIHPLLNVPMSPSPSPLITSVEYDRLGRAVRLKDPDIGSERRLYSGFGELKQSSDANGGVTTYSRDRLGRPTLVSTPANQNYLPGPSGWAQRTEFTWDSASHGIGKLANARSADGVLNTLTYDDYGRSESASWRVDGTTYRFTQAYDLVGRLEYLGYPHSFANEPFSVKFGYGLNGVVREITDMTAGSGTGTAPKPALLWQGLSIHPSGAIDEQQFGSATRDLRRFDFAHQLRYIESRDSRSPLALQRLAYTWGAGGFVNSKTDLVTGARETYGHDFLGRLDSWSVDQNCERSEWRYEYDDLGNLRKRDRLLGAGASVVSDYTLPGSSAHPHSVKRITEAGVASTYDYLPGGQARLARGVATSWRPFGLPQSMTDGWRTTTVSYDAFSSRVRTSEATPRWQRDLISLGGLFEKEVTSAGSVFTYRVAGPEGLVAQVRRDTRSGNTTQFFHADHLGSAELVTDQGGGVVERAKFDPFGERRHYWALTHPIAESLVLNDAVGFTGHQSVDRYGLIDMKGRIYDPKAGRFLSADPFLGPSSESLNRFSYVRNSPVMRIDPSGFANVDFEPMIIIGDPTKPPAPSPGEPKAQPVPPNGSTSSQQNGTGTTTDQNSEVAPASSTPVSSEESPSSGGPSNENERRNMEWFVSLDPFEQRRALTEMGAESANTVNGVTLPSMAEVEKLDVDLTWDQFMGAASVLSVVHAHAAAPAVTQSVDWFFRGAANDGKWLVAPLRQKALYELGQGSVNNALFKTLPQGNEFAQVVGRGEALLERANGSWLRALLGQSSPSVAMRLAGTGPTPAFRFATYAALGGAAGCGVSRSCADSVVNAVGDHWYVWTPGILH